MAKHWLMDAVAGPIDLSSVEVELTIDDVMADLAPAWADLRLPATEAAAFQREGVAA